MTNLATVIAARLMIAAIDGGASIMDIMDEGHKMRPDLEWPSGFLAPLSSITQPVDAQDAPTDPDNPE